MAMIGCPPHVDEEGRIRGKAPSWPLRRRSCCRAAGGERAVGQGRAGPLRRGGPAVEPRTRALPPRPRPARGRTRDVALVAVHSWDVHGARRAGLTTGWCSRIEGAFPSIFALTGGMEKGVSPPRASVRRRCRGGRQPRRTRRCRRGGTPPGWSRGAGRRRLARGCPSGSWSGRRRSRRWCGRR